MVDREDVHRLVDAVPEARLPVVEQLLRSSLAGPVLTERLRLSEVITLDRRHFSVVRQRHVGSLTLLP